jgi:hypothetical protein
MSLSQKHTNKFITTTSKVIYANAKKAMQSYIELEINKNSNYHVLVLL